MSGGPAREGLACDALRAWRAEFIEGWLRDGARFDAGAASPDNAPMKPPMKPPMIDLSPLRKALAQLNEALQFWHALPEGAALKPHLRSAVIQSFEFSYELSVRLTRRVLVERAESADRVTDLALTTCCVPPRPPV